MNQRAGPLSAHEAFSHAASTSAGSSEEDANAADGARSAALMRRLAQLKPDMLILGGDTLRGGDAKPAQSFFEALSAFDAPLGKFAVAGEAEGDAQSLKSAFQNAGADLLLDACTAVERSGAQLVIAGLSDVSRKETPYSELGRAFSGSECVLAVAHNLCLERIPQYAMQNSVIISFFSSCATIAITILLVLLSPDFASDQ